MKYLYISLFILISNDCFSQSSTDNEDTVIAAGPQYHKTKFHQWLWGSNRRKEWTVRVKVPLFRLDKFEGELHPYKEGGGNETKSLHLRTSTGKEYTLHSIDKSRSDVVLPQFKNTFVEDIIKDGVSMSYPYGAFALAEMQKAAGIYHTLPQLVYVPKQPALDTFNTKFGDDLYLFEQRFDGDWSDADNLGNPRYFTDTDDLQELLVKDGKSQSAQFEFIKARLFDMLIADWDRHEDNWKWGSSDTVNATYYPIPRDRDQAFYTHDGFLIDKILPATGLGYMQNFDYKVHDMKTFNYEEADMDRFFANEMTKADWLKAAKLLQQQLTDSVIRLSIQQLPPEVYAISGEELISKLEVRRKYIPQYAEKYYAFLAKEVEITGSRRNEYFEVSKRDDSITLVNIFLLTDTGKPGTPVYSRKFYTSETNEIRLFGIDGSDVYAIKGTGNKMRVRIIGGPARDSIAADKNYQKIFIYDNENNAFNISKAKFRLSKDSSVHNFKYHNYKYNSSGFTPSFFYNNEDRFYIGIGYQFTKHTWRKEPFAWKQSFNIHYSLSQNAFSVNYSALFPTVIKKWDWEIFGDYDAIRWTNFFGPGNDSQQRINDISYYRLRTRELLAGSTLSRQLKKNTFAISDLFQKR